MNYICAECKKPCVPRVVDLGIGPYEYWGSKCVDRRPALVSDCCEAEVLDENGWVISAADYEDGIKDAEADDRNDERWLRENEKEV